MGLGHVVVRHELLNVGDPFPEAGEAAPPGIACWVNGQSQRST